MDTDALKISVIIPCFNAERYVAQTLGSVLDQTLKPVEIIIVDDGSTDGSLDILRRFAAACPQLIRVCSRKSGSAARTRNLGAAMASGNALMFLDADDVLAPDALEWLAAALDTHTGAVAACPWQRLALQPEGWVSGPASCAPRRADDDALSAWMTGWYYPPCAVLWSKEAFLQTGGWDENARVNDDGDLMMRALAGGVPLVETDRGSAFYRRLPSGETSLSSTQHSFEGLRGRLAVLEKIARILDEQGQLKPYRRPLSQAFALIANDAVGKYAGLYQQARANQRRYAPLVWHHLWERHKPWRLRPPVSRPGSMQTEPIRFGEERAELIVCGAQPASQAQAKLSPAPISLPKVSVIITVYNRAELLRRSIASVLEQTFGDFELLVVDDCSTDDPESVIRAFGDTRIRYLRQSENQGVAAARNRGLRESRAPFVAFLDDDDEWFPDKLAQQVALFSSRNTDVGLVYTGAETLTGHGEPLVHTPSARGDLYREMLARNLVHGTCGVMIRRNVITEIGFFDETLPAIEDYDFWLRIARYYKFDCISAPLVRYHDVRDAPDSDTRRSRNIRANLEARRQFYLKHGAQMRDAGLAHAFLMDSARRHLPPNWHDIEGARRLTVKAFLLAPTSWEIRQVVPKLLRL